MAIRIFHESLLNHLQIGQNVVGTSKLKRWQMVNKVPILSVSQLLEMG